MGLLLYAFRSMPVGNFIPNADADDVELDIVKDEDEETTVSATDDGLLGVSYGR